MTFEVKLYTRNNKSFLYKNKRFKNNINILLNVKDHPQNILYVNPMETHITSESEWESNN